MNRSLERFAPPMASSSVEATRRGLVNEAAFRLFAATRSTRQPVSTLDHASTEAAWMQAALHVRTMRQYGRTPLDPMARTGELEEALTLASRITSFFAGYNPEEFHVEPKFFGCGWVNEARGDVLTDSTLFEIKAGERHFRSVDVQQLLTYCALNFATKTFNITHVGLVNPRVGTFIVFDLDDLCIECAGCSAADVLDDIIQYISEPLGDEDR